MMFFANNSLSYALFGENTPRFAAFVGGGGKTTAIETLADEFVSAGERVVVTTTTKTHPPEDLSILAADAADAAKILGNNKLCHLGEVIIPNRRMCGVSDEELFKLRAICDRVLSESDGSRVHSIKIPREHEPVIPKAADAVVFVAGLDAVGMPVAEAAHYPELVCEFLGVSERHIVTARDIGEIFLRLYVKKAAAQNGAARLYILLNKNDGGKREKQAAELAGFLGDYRVAVR